MPGKVRAETQIDNRSQVGDGYFLRSDGSVGMEAPLQMKGNTIEGVPLPVAGTDVANKDYVDAQGGGGGGGGTSNGRRDYVLNAAKPVPAQGTLYLFIGSVSTLAAPLAVNAASTLTSASVLVDTGDANDYVLEVLVNGTVEASVALAASQVYASAVHTVSISAGDQVVGRIVRTTGSGESLFSTVSATIEFEET